MNEDFESESCVYLPLGNASISFRIKNEGSISEIFSYEFSEEYDWFSNQDGSVELEPGEEQVITFVGETNSSTNNSSCQLIVVPSQRPSLEKTVINEIFISSSLFVIICLLYTSPSPRDVEESRMPSSA